MTFAKKKKNKIKYYTMVQGGIRYKLCKQIRDL